MISYRGLVSVGAVGASALLLFKAVGSSTDILYLAPTLFGRVFSYHKLSERKYEHYVDHLNLSTHGFKLLTKPMSKDESLFLGSYKIVLLIKR